MPNLEQKWKRPPSYERIPSSLRPSYPPFKVKYARRQTGIDGFETVVIKLLNGEVHTYTGTQKTKNGYWWRRVLADGSVMKENV